MLSLAYKKWQDATDKEILAQLAIQAAISSDWKEATKINQKILEVASDDTEALNRLAHAYICLGNKEKSQKVYKKVLEVDPYNIIANKNLEKISKLNDESGSNGQSKTNDLTSLFLFEPGKTKVINLLNLAPPSVLAALNCGDQISLNPKKHSVSIITQDGCYLGALPDDLAHRLIAFIAGGNKYEAYVKYATTKTLTIFIRETQRAAKFINQPSFQESRSHFEEKETISF